MTIGALWRILGPACVVAFPFGVLLADRGVPEGTWWDESGDPAVWVLAVLGGLAFAHGIVSVMRLPRQRRAVIEADLERLARRAFVPINERLPEVPINRLGVHVWTTDGQQLKRLVKYTMEQQRVETPITWTRGKGVIGLAWERKQAVVADLTGLYAEAAQRDAASFEQLDSDFRYGLSAAEVASGGHYKSVLAYPLTAEDNDVIGVLSVDCAVPEHHHHLEQLLEDPQFQNVLGSCESALRRY